MNLKRLRINVIFFIDKYTKEKSPRNFRSKHTKLNNQVNRPTGLNGHLNIKDYNGTFQTDNIYIYIPSL